MPRAYYLALTLLFMVLLPPLILYCPEMYKSSLLLSYLLLPYMYVEGSSAGQSTVL